jgi:MFS family permease
VGLAAFAMVSSTLFLTYEFQGRLGLSPFLAGVAFLPLTAGIMLGALALGGPLLPRLGARLLVGLGAGASFSGMVLLWSASDSLGYIFGILPGISVVGIGLGIVFAVATPTATAGVRASEGGIASASLSSSQQLGAALGVAATSTLAATFSAERITYAVAAAAFILILGLTKLLPRSTGRSVE